jgi:hypothetical protein
MLFGKEKVLHEAHHMKPSPYQRFVVIALSKDKKECKRWQLGIDGG